MNIDDNSNDIPLTFHDNIVDAQIFSKKLLNYIIFTLIALFIFFLYYQLLFIIHF